MWSGFTLFATPAVFKDTFTGNKIDVQGAATSSLFPPPLFQDTWLRVQLLCVERNAPCQWDLAIDKAKPLMSAEKWQGNDQTALQCQAARRCHHQIQWATCAAWHWGAGPHFEGEKVPLVWTCGTLQWRSQDSLYLQVEGKRGSGRPKMTWKQLTERDCREWKLSAINPHDRHTWRSSVRSYSNILDTSGGSRMDYFKF